MKVHQRVAHKVLKARCQDQLHYYGTTKMDIDEASNGMDETKYRGMIGLLLSLTTIRPNIVFSVGLFARFQSIP